MKTLLCSVLLLLASIASAQCKIAPFPGVASQVTATCNLPALAVDQCVHYKFNWKSGAPSSGSFAGTVTLNSATVVSAPNSGSMNFNSVFQLSGTVCNNAAQNVQWAASDPAVQDLDFIYAQFFASLAEDLSLPSTLTFSTRGQRGFGIQFMGGTVEIF